MKQTQYRKKKSVLNTQPRWLQQVQQVQALLPHKEKICQPLDWHSILSSDYISVLFVLS